MPTLSSRDLAVPRAGRPLSTLDLRARTAQGPSPRSVRAGAVPTVRRSSARRARRRRDPRDRERLASVAARAGVVALDRGGLCLPHVRRARDHAWWDRSRAPATAPGGHDRILALHAFAATMGRVA